MVRRGESVVAAGPSSTDGAQEDSTKFLLPQAPSSFRVGLRGQPIRRQLFHNCYAITWLRVALDNCHS